MTIPEPAEQISPLLPLSEENRQILSYDLPEKLIGMPVADLRQRLDLEAGYLSIHDSRLHPEVAGAL